MLFGRMANLDVVYTVRVFQLIHRLNAFNVKRLYALAAYVYVAKQRNNEEHHE